MTALSTVTYLDMAIRGRPASDTAERSVRKLTDAPHVDLGEDKQRAQNRVAGLGPLLGTATGLGVAAAYALLTRGRRPAPGTAAVALTVGAMVATNGSMTALGITDPRTWSLAGWVADMVPHAAYGATTALALRLMPG